MQWTERANWLGIKFCEYAGCSILIVEKCCSYVLKKIVLVSISLKCFLFLSSRWLACLVIAWHSVQHILCKGCTICSSTYVEPVTGLTTLMLGENAFVIYQTQGRVFHQISKHSEVGWKNEAQPVYLIASQSIFLEKRKEKVHRNQW